MRTTASILTTILLGTILCLCAVAGSAAPTPAAGAGLQKATFAGGCFWCMEPPFERKPGVVSVTSGYVGGRTVDPSYEEVSAGSTGHAEAVEIVFDPSKISYAKLLDIYWHNIDPTVKGSQFCDIGDPYRSAIFFHDAEQQRLAKETHAAHAKSPRFAGKTIYTEVVPAAAFYAAEDYHQDYASKNPKRYSFYRWNCGRDKRLQAIWAQRLRTDRNIIMKRREWLNGALTLLGLGVVSGCARAAPETKQRFEFELTQAQWRERLTPAQYRVLREEATEAAGSSPLDQEKRTGTYQCAGCDLALYASEAKFESGTGWPSFTQPLPNAVATRQDDSFFAVRTEVHCRRCGGHLGHVFDDGPPPTGLRYCMNGVALTFKPSVAAVALS